jgi:hypothetical protein
MAFRERDAAPDFQREITKLWRFVGILGASHLVIIAFATAACYSARAINQQEFLTVRGLSVVDETGTVRVRIGAPLPDPVSNGHQGKRDAPLSGILVYDAAGDERGGYATDDVKSGGNALLTLDSKDDQVVTLVAYPHRGAELGLQHVRGSAVALRSLKEGSSIVILNDGNVSFKQP